MKMWSLTICAVVFAGCAAPVPHAWQRVGVTNEQATVEMMQCRAYGSTVGPQKARMFAPENQCWNNGVALVYGQLAAYVEQATFECMLGLGYQWAPVPGARAAR